jgi:hypothetical protein
VVNGAGDPANGLEVVVLHDKRRISSRAITGPDSDEDVAADGSFEVLLREVPPGAQLVVRPTEDVPPGVAPNRLQPTVVVPIDPVVGEVELPHIALGAGETLRVQGTVTTAKRPARGATVLFHAQVGAGVFATREVTGDDGAFDVFLIAGEYAVAAVPAADSRAGLLVRGEPFVVVASSDPEPLVLALPSRVDATVQVLSNDGAAVPSASLTFQRVGDAFGLAEPVLQDAQPVFLGSADGDGKARVVVDRGRYRVSITPPRGSGAPAFSTLVTVDGTFSRDFVLPPQDVLAGIVVDSRGGVAPGAFVRVFSHLTDEQGRAIFLGEAVCADDGSFAVPVPDLSP